MESTRQELFEKLVTLQKELTQNAIQYWKLYSGFNTWQFWACLAIMVGPLIVIYFTIDRRRIFQIGFFGFAVHILFAYIDASGIRSGLWGYPYQVLPFLPSLSLDAAIIPVAIMLVYQWTIRHSKNFYLYAILTAVVFGFGFKPLLVYLNLFEKYQWVNYPLIFLLYLVLYLLAYWLTRLFLIMRKEA
ncbi:hypothetical protein DNH61_04930 [Paenibacillus sambharensis]|uniref:Uncharacterized protein n=1 Tax=Paenibacillus sambharensis TaxID=1803190 RepID=A0A2W1LR45_9BACL|nr:CBO0543 family protein [Paenibacillus sambharensis]PZD96994.1 hypothetical protein DNH61_04930 [Paenibacillus sambharensis]